MHSELLTDRDIYNKNFPTFSHPKIVGFLSLDSARNYHSNTSQLKYARNIKEGKVNFDLNSNRDIAILRLKNLNEKISHLLEFLMEHEKRLSLTLQKSLDSSNFFCYRGLLTCIACSPYENREPWRIVATLYKGNIYLCALDTEEKIHRENNMSERDKQCTSWGYKFEHFVLSDKPNTDPNPNTGCDENEEFSLILKTHLNRHTIIYGAEMDGITCDNDNMPEPPSEELGPEAIIQYLSDKQFIELKTCAHLEFPNQHHNFRRFKTRKWWLQSFFAGVDRILCGFRSNEGIVENLKTFKLNDLARMSERFWKPNICINFLDQFLTYVKRCLQKEIKMKHGDRALNQIHTLPRISLQFEWSPQNAVRVTDSYCYDSDPILPEWFVDNYTKRNVE